MGVYTIAEAIAAIVAGILIAACTKKAEHVTYNKLDKAGRITNILLIPVYLYLAPLCLFIGLIAGPEYDGFLGLLGLIVSVLISSAALFCGLGLGFSVALRKKGKSKWSFAVQFAGLAGIGLTILLYGLFAGNLVSTLN